MRRPKLLTEQTNSLAISTMKKANRPNLPWQNDLSVHLLPEVGNLIDQIENVLEQIVQQIFHFDKRTPLQSLMVLEAAYWFDRSIQFVTWRTILSVHLLPQVGNLIDQIQNVLEQIVQQIFHFDKRTPLQSLMVLEATYWFDRSIQFVTWRKILSVHLLPQVGNLIDQIQNVLEQLV